MDTFIKSILISDSFYHYSNPSAVPLGHIVFAFSPLAALFSCSWERERDREQYIYKRALKAYIIHPNTHPHLIITISLIYEVKIMMSSPQKLSLTVFLLCSSILLTVRVAVTSDIRHYGQHRQAVKKLFVFGDSYVDTGNNRKSVGSSWKDPYGITFPGKPTGRFSDGRVFTDFLGSCAAFLICFLYLLLFFWGRSSN